MAVDVYFPLSVGNADGNIRGVGIEHRKNLMGQALNAEGRHVGIVMVDGMNRPADLFPSAQPQAVVGLAEGDQAPVVIHIFLIFFFIKGIPLDGVDPVGGAVAVVIEAALFAGLGP